MKDLEDFTEDELRAELKRREVEAEVEVEDKDLETKFKEALEEASAEIQKCLNMAEDALDQAVELSEKYGVPFESKLSSAIPRKYIPESFYTKWEGADLREMLDSIDMYVDDLEPGWEYWNTSSLTC